jgi:hypothetical protein
MWDCTRKENLRLAVRFANSRCGKLIEASSALAVSAQGTTHCLNIAVCCSDTLFFTQIVVAKQ